MNLYLEKLAALPWSRVLILSLILGVGFYYTLYDSGVALDARLQVAEKNQSESRLKLEATKKADKNVKVFIQKVEEAQKQFQNVVSYMPADMNLGNFLQKVKDQASAAGASVQAFSPSSDSEKREFYEIRKFDLQLNGNFSQILSFLSNLSKMPLLVTFDKISLKKEGGEFDNPKLSFKGTLVGYRYLKETSPKNASGAK
jgi:Tfp pilus assembly protein PilO